jgi:hypothetical protein
LIDLIDINHGSFIEDLKLYFLRLCYFESADKSVKNKTSSFAIGYISCIRGTYSC